MPPNTYSAMEISKSSVQYAELPAAIEPKSSESSVIVTKALFVVIVAITEFAVCVP